MHGNKVVHECMYIHIYICVCICVVSHELAAGGLGLCLRGIGSRKVDGIALRERPTVVWLNLADIP